MSQMTQPELHSLHELLWMEAAMYEKFRLYRKQAGETHIRELCDHLLGRTRQHVTALAQLLRAELPGNDGPPMDRSEPGQSQGDLSGKMTESAILRDCLDTLKHASMSYLQASHEADSDRLRETFQNLAIDKGEQKNAVFNLMHQAGMYPTRPANPDHVAELKRHCEDLLGRIGAAQAVERERGRVDERRIHV